LDSLLDFQRKAPSASLAHPTLEHYLPLLVAAGAGLDEPVSFPQDGFELGSISRRCVQFG
jgi:4,5-DOPA dioxygenase extradiol